MFIDYSLIRAADTEEVKKLLQWKNLLSLFLSELLLIACCEVRSWALDTESVWGRDTERQCLSLQAIAKDIFQELHLSNSWKLW